MTATFYDGVGQRVLVSDPDYDEPLRGKVVCHSIIPQGYLVVFSRRDYSPEQWADISPGNGPCVYRAYTEAQIQFVKGE